MPQYTEASNRRSTAAPRRGARQGNRTGRGRAGRGGGGRALAGALLAAVTLAASCPTATSPMAPPDSVVLAELAPPYYSLQVSADREQWVAVFADTAELTLKLARGPLAATEAAVSSVIAVDRIDVPPGINPYFGRHAYLQHDGVEHLFYSDQELADVRVTKWVYRETASDAPWTVDLLPEAVLPLAVLPVPAEPSDRPGFTLFGAVGTAGGEANGDAVVAYEVQPDDLTDPSAAAVAGRRVIMTGVAQTQSDGGAGPAVSAYACAGRNGFAAADGAGLLLVEDTQGPRRVALHDRPAAAAGPTALGCGPQGMLIVYTRDDPRAMRTSSGPALQAREVVAVDVAAGGAAGTEIKVTLAREVSVLAVFPEPPRADSGTPALTVLFSELALDDSGEPEYRLSLVTPDDAGGYRKRVLVRGARPVQDLRALRVGGELVVAFRRARELRLLQAQLGTRGEVRLQSGGSW